MTKNSCILNMLVTFTHLFFVSPHLTHQIQAIDLRRSEAKMDLDCLIVHIIVLEIRICVINQCHPVIHIICVFIWSSHGVQLYCVKFDFVPTRHVTQPLLPFSQVFLAPLVLPEMHNKARRPLKDGCPKHGQGFDEPLVTAWPCQARFWMEDNSDEEKHWGSTWWKSEWVRVWGSVSLQATSRTCFMIFRYFQFSETSI